MSVRLIERLGDGYEGQHRREPTGNVQPQLVRKDAEGDCWDYPVEAQLSDRLRDRYHQLHCEVENDREIPLPNRPLDQLTE